jgi:hypothetical protein
MHAEPPQWTTPKQPTTPHHTTLRYYALNGINILLLLARLLRRLDFQPRLGVVTRSLARAGPDLAHFAVVFGLVFFG